MSKAFFLTKYDEQLDEFICANQKRLTFQAERKRTLENGYVSVQRTYRCTECIGCPFQEKCAKGKDQKSIYLSLKNVQQRQEIRERFHLKGLSKVTVEWSLVSIRHNLKKMKNLVQRKQIEIV